MARFEQRITESEVNAAREAIAEGASLRSAAAKIPCAPSTLSARLKKAVARGSQVVVQTNGSGEHDPVEKTVQPLEVLRGALLATKTNGEPHWPTRLAAVRMLATLRPEEFASTKEERRTEPSVVVFDLEPGAVSVLHRPLRNDEPAVTSEDVPQARHEISATFHNFSLETPDGEWLPIGSWSAPTPDGAITVSGVFHRTVSAEEAERWRSELSAGIFPTDIEDGPA